MKNVFIISWKEIKGFLLSPTFYIVAFLCMFILSWIYPISFKLFVQLAQNFVYKAQIPKQQLNIHYSVFIRLLSYLNLIFIVLVPALTMKLVSEEKKLGTFDLLLTSPITSWNIIIGKYIAGFTAVFLILAISFLYPLSTAYFVDTPWSMLLIAYLGFLLVAAVYTAMDLFCSSVTQSALVAYVMSVILNISIWFVGIGSEVVDSNTVRKIFEHISLNTHLSGFLQGNLRISAIVFFLSIIGLFCFLAERVVESSRWR